MKKVEQINSFSYFTISTLGNRDFQLTSLCDAYLGDKVSLDFNSTSISVDDHRIEISFSSDNPRWILKTFLPYLKAKLLNPEMLLNDEDFDNLEVTPTEIKDVIELIELGIKIGMLKDESA